MGDSFKKANNKGEMKRVVKCITVLFDFFRALGMKSSSFFNLILFAMKNNDCVTPYKRDAM